MVATPKPCHRLKAGKPWLSQQLQSLTRRFTPSLAVMPRVISHLLHPMTGTSTRIPCYWRAVGENVISLISVTSHTVSSRSLPPCAIKTLLPSRFLSFFLYPSLYIYVYISLPSPRNNTKCLNHLQLDRRRTQLKELPSVEPQTPSTSSVSLEACNTSCFIACLLQLRPQVFNRLLGLSQTILLFYLTLPGLPQRNIAAKLPTLRSCSRQTTTCSPSLVQALRNAKLGSQGDLPGSQRSHTQTLALQEAISAPSFPGSHARRIGIEGWNIDMWTHYTPTSYRSPTPVTSENPVDHPVAS